MSKRRYRVSTKMLLMLGLSAVSLWRGAGMLEKIDAGNGTEAMVNPLAVQEILQQVSLGRAAPDVPGGLPPEVAARLRNGFSMDQDAPPHRLGSTDSADLLLFPDNEEAEDGEKRSEPNPDSVVRVRVGKKAAEQQNGKAAD